MRLAEHRLLETSWETTAEGRPPRHMYKLTEDGVRYARAQLSATAARAAGLRGLVGVEG
jgi:DNA-binding PadR family transcriptional regulator